MAAKKKAAKKAAPKKKAAKKAAPKKKAVKKTARKKRSIEKDDPVLQAWQRGESIDHEENELE